MFQDAGWRGGQFEFPDLMQGKIDAVGGMIDLLGTLHGLAAAEAYMLCSVCADQLYATAREPTAGQVFSSHRLVSYAPALSGSRATALSASTAARRVVA